MIIFVSNSYFDESFKEKFYIDQWGHALAILTHDFPDQFVEITDVLSRFELKKSDLMDGGGSKSKISGYLDSELYSRGWKEKGFNISVSVDGVEHSLTTHKIDCVKNRIALDIEWNNKTEFYDRDLKNFKMLHEIGAISVGIIVTRTTELQTSIFKPLGIGSKYGASTTHLDKLTPKIENGAAGGCPILIFGIKSGAFVDSVIASHS